ncbi:MAG: ATP-binding protein [Verrucomicrobiota bacterium]|nr:ATP-binding protein [Verrucomicrobiota bacterium]
MSFTLRPLPLPGILPGSGDAPKNIPDTSRSAAWLQGGMAVLDAEEKIVQINEHLALWLGVKAEEAIGQLAELLLQKRDIACALKFKELWNRGAFAEADFSSSSQQSQEWFTMEVARHAGGGYLRLNSSLPPLFELEESAWDEHLGNNAARRQMFIRLLRAEAQLNNLIHRWPGVIFTQRADFSFLFVSERIAELTGVDSMEWRAQPTLFWQAVHEADAEELQQQFKKLSPRNDRHSGTYRIRHAQTGRITYVYEHREAIFSSNGLLLGYEGVWLDVTRQTIAEKRLSSAAWKETLAILTMGLAHDFSNIMAGILSLSEAFQAQVDKQHPFQEGLALIKRNSMQASQLVQRILNLHQGKVGERNYHSLNDLVADTVEVVRKIIPRRIELSTEYSSEQLPLYVDPVEFRQVLINLTLNAVDAMPQSGHLIFKTSRCQEYPVLNHVQGTLPRTPAICLTVEDNGVGIPEKLLKTIFDPFFTTKAMNKGNGLGLYNARLFADKHHGAISVQSTEKVGTTFQVWLPEADFSENERFDEEETQQRHTLLLVGEAPRDIEGCAKFLRQNGYYVVVPGPDQRASDVLSSPDYQFAGVMLLHTREATETSTALDQITSVNSKLKKILQIVGCNQDELDTQILSKADLVISSDVPQPEVLLRLTSLLK